MIELFFFESVTDAIAAAKALEKLGGRAKRLLAECIEHQIVIRKSVSDAAKALENEGFIFINESDDLYEKSVELKPSLWGEEAMYVLEFLASNSPALITMAPYYTLPAHQNHYEGFL